MKRMAENRQQYYRRGRVQTMSELEKFEQGWTKEMITYWRERLLKVRAYNTGALYKSFTGSIHGNTIEHKFLLYGIYVAAGVGREFGKGYTDSLGRTYESSRGGEGTLNDGQLPFLLPGGYKYRMDHGLNKKKKVGPAWGGEVAGGKPRQKRDWFSKKYYSSIMVLGEVEASFYGEAYMGLVADALDDMYNHKGPAGNL